MKLIKNGINLSQSKIIYQSNVLSKIVHKGIVIYRYGEDIPYFPRPLVHVGVIGDSTIAAGFGGLVIPEYVPEFRPYTSVAKGGDTIQGQRSKFAALTNHSDYDVVIMQIGLNDMNVNQTTQTVLNNYQSFVDYIRSVVDVRCKIYVSQMLPCKQRYINLYGPDNGALAYQRWVDLNYAIASTITNVDGRITSHVAILNDGNDNLKAEYDTGDRIHENVAGRQVIANSWRDKLITDQILSV